MKRSVAAILAIPALCLSQGTARADALEACVAREVQKLEQAQSFQSTGRVTCPPGDIVGFPPRKRIHNRQGTHSYAAPAGFEIAAEPPNSPLAVDVSNTNGRIGAVSVTADGSSASVPIACTGKGPTEGRAWQEVRLEGIIRRPVSDAQRKEILRNCARN